MEGGTESDPLQIPTHKTEGENGQKLSVKVYKKVLEESYFTHYRFINH